MKPTFSPRRQLAVASLVSVNLFNAPATLAEEGAAELAEVQVSASSAVDYRTRKVKIGPLAEKDLLDTPYAIDVVPEELLRNQQLKSVREAFRYLPSVQGENIRPQTRGMQAGVVQNARIDGMNIASTTDYPIEQFERIEVLNGLAGALYGPANPAGTFNYVVKRPTAQPLRRFTLGYATQSSWLGSADISDYADANKVLGYRLNLLNDSGEGYVDRSRLERKLASLALDLNFSEASKLELNASRYHYRSMGFPGTFSLNAGVNFPSVPDPKKVGYGQPFGGDDNITKTYSGTFKHDFNQDWHLSAGLLQQDSDRASTVPTNTLTNNAGRYQVRVVTTTYTLDRILSNTVALNGRVRTGDITHDLVLSSTGFDWDRSIPYSLPSNGGILLGSATLDDPLVFNEPALPDFKSRYRALNTRQQTVTLGDSIGFNERWSLGLFASKSWIKVRNYNSAGVTSPVRIDDDGLSGNATLSYKPQPNMTVYTSYADSLQQGDTATVTVAGKTSTTILDAYRSKQWELGYKWAVGGMNLGAALFRIERPYAYTSNNVFQVQGDQVNRGLELTANGALTQDLSIFSGVTYLDPRVYDTAAAANDGKQILGLARVVSSLLLDYRVPGVPGLALSFHVSHTTSRPGNHSNTDMVDGYTVADLGARYSNQIMGKLATWNLALNNAANERYWANITPNGQNGYSGSGLSTGTLGAPRTLRASLQLDF